MKNTISSLAITGTLFSGCAGINNVEIPNLNPFGNSNSGVEKKRVDIADKKEDVIINKVDDLDIQETVINPNKCYFDTKIGELNIPGVSKNDCSLSIEKTKSSFNKFFLGEKNTKSVDKISSFLTKKFSKKNNVKNLSEDRLKTLYEEGNDKCDNNGSLNKEISFNNNSSAVDAVFDHLMCTVKYSMDEVLKNNSDVVLVYSKESSSDKKKVINKSDGEMDSYSKMNYASALKDVKNRLGKNTDNDFGIHDFVNQNITILDGNNITDIQKTYFIGKFAYFLAIDDEIDLYEDYFKDSSKLSYFKQKVSEYYSQVALDLVEKINNPVLINEKYKPVSKIGDYIEIKRISAGFKLNEIGKKSFLFKKGTGKGSEFAFSIHKLGKN